MFLTTIVNLQVVMPSPRVVKLDKTGLVADGRPG
jgi:hypothetical protein